jgi:hypothetical protein
MPMTFLEILDSAVKIGLGAAISGYATYRVTELSHSRERAQLRDGRVNVGIERAAEHFETYYVLLSRHVLIVRSHIKRGNTAPVPINDSLYATAIAPMEIALDEVRKDKILVSSRLRLIGAIDAVGHLNKMIEIEGRIRATTAFRRELPSDSEIDADQKELGRLRIEFYKCLEARYFGP